MVAGDRLERTRLSKEIDRWRSRAELKPLGIFVAIAFTCLLILALNRYHTLFVSYDHGLFNQLFWNNLHGHFFQSSLSSGNSAGVLQDGKVQSVSYSHLGQHFVPDFCCGFLFMQFSLTL